MYIRKCDFESYHQDMLLLTALSTTAVQQRLSLSLVNKIFYFDNAVNNIFTTAVEFEYCQQDFDCVVNNSCTTVVDFESYQQDMLISTALYSTAVQNRFSLSIGNMICCFFTVLSTTAVYQWLSFFSTRYVDFDCIVNNSCTTAVEFEYYWQDSNSTAVVQLLSLSIIYKIGSFLTALSTTAVHQLLSLSIANTICWFQLCCQQQRYNSGWVWVLTTRYVDFWLRCQQQLYISSWFWDLSTRYVGFWLRCQQQLYKSGWVLSTRYVDFYCFGN